jgi:5'-nucleotidase
MKRSFSLLLFLLVACATAPAPEPVHVVVVATTDLHGWFNGHVEAPKPGEPGVVWGGLPLLASYVDTLRQENPGRVIVVDSGDMWQGTLESNLSEGEPVVHAYNLLGYAAAAVGNHEFDFGPIGPDPIPHKPGDDPHGALKRNAAIADFPLLSANMTDKATGKAPAWAQPYTIVRAGGARIGIIGLSTADTPNVTMRANVLTLDFTDPVSATIAAAKELRAQKVDAIIVIAHIGGRCTKVDEPHSIESCDRQQEAMHYLEALPPGTIDAFFGGHTHAQMRQFVNGVPTAQALAYSREFSTLDLWIDTAHDRVVTDKTVIRPHTMICSFVYEGTDQCDPRRAPAGAKLVPRVFDGKAITPDAKIAQMIDPYLRRVAAKRSEKLGARTTDRFVRAYSSESTLGDLLTDLMREASGADVAFMNSGGIRADLPAGDLVYSDVFEVSPFDNYPAVVQLSGKQIFESMQATTGGQRGIFQVSGLRYTIDATKDADKDPAAKRRVTSVTLANGDPLDPDKLYKVVMPDFVAAGGDGMMDVMSGVPPERVQIFYGKTIRDIVADLIRARAPAGPLVPKLEQRITVLNLTKPSAEH